MYTTISLFILVQARLLFTFLFSGTLIGAVGQFTAANRSFVKMSKF